MNFENITTSNNKLLWVHFRAMGDVLQAGADAYNFKQKYPNIHLTILTEPTYVQLFEEQSWCDAVIAGDKIPFSKYWQTLCKVKQLHFDYLMVPRHQGLRALIMGLFGGISCRIGKSTAQFLYKYHIDEWQQKYNINLLEREQIVFKPTSCRPMVYKGADKLVGKKLFAVIGASVEHKRWGVDKWVSFIKQLSTEGWSIVLIGSGAVECAIAEQIMQILGSPDNVLNLVGKLKVAELVDVASICTTCVGNDTGPLHLAALAGVPTVGIADLEVFTAIGLRMKWFKAVTVHGQPTKRINSTKGRSNEVLNTITPERVYTALQELLNEEKLRNGK